MENKTADNMFKDIGYKKKTDDNNWNIIYIDDDNEQYIEFDRDIKTFKTNGYICIEELQAINKKVEELGWNE